MDPEAEHHLTLSPARQEEEEEVVRGESKAHSQDNGQSVELLKLLRTPRHVEERQRGKMKEERQKEKKESC